MSTVIPACKSIFCQHTWGKVKNTVEPKFDSFKESFNECCSSDSKIYMLVIFGRLLQAAAIVATVASVVYTFVIGPIALAGLVPPIAAFLLGHFIVQRYKEQKDYYPVIPILDHFFPRKFIPGQPVGLRNTNMNCWISSFMQCVVHIPVLRERARLIPELRESIDIYLNAQDTGKEAVVLDFAPLNAFLLNLVRGMGHIDNVNARQADATVLFEWLLGLHPEHGINNYLYDITSRRAKYNGTVEEKANVLNDLIRLNPQADVDESASVMFNGFWNYHVETDDANQPQIKHNEPVQLKLNAVPPTLACHIRRYTTKPDPLNPKRIVPVHITRDIEGVDGEFTIPETALPNGEEAVFSCVGFVVHIGGFHGGHYVAYVKKEGIWWKCDDSRIIPISEREAMVRMRHCYLFFANRQNNEPLDSAMA